jgi:hypothetical protein
LLAQRPARALGDEGLQLRQVQLQQLVDGPPIALSCGFRELLDVRLDRRHGGGLGPISDAITAGAERSVAGALNFELLVTAALGAGSGLSAGRIDGTDRTLSWASWSKSKA